MSTRPVKLDSRLGRLVQRAAQTSSFSPVALKVAPMMDKVISRLTRGRFTLTSLIVPTLVLTTTGAKSGQPRTTPLATMPDGDDAFYVVGSNFGTAKHPGWSANLMKTPRATVVYRGTTMQVDATLLSDEEKAAVWPRLTKVWPTYDTYVAKTDRNLRVFRLSRAS
ncbi:MAG: nitroreductase family deazaflavin-dependent oxidoreductase [Frankiaceae bacterium]|nr:nitroreductase family deazaflavin-dependent oxidoreductase [Frankiaceae bacterium]